MSFRSSALPSVLLAATFASPAVASDLYVNPGRPGAYPDLQAAHDAAQPGDRILIEVDLPVVGETVIRKSLTIESIDQDRRKLRYLGTATQPGRFLVDSLTPGTPLTLRSLAMEFYRDPGSSRALVGIRVNPGLRGKVFMDNMSVDNGTVRPQLSTLLMDFDSQLAELWLRDTRMIAKDTLPGDGCAGAILDRDGSDILRCNCRILVIEDSELIAGSAAFIRYNGCSNQAPFGGDGGTGIWADVDATSFTRFLTSDGNGGDVQSGPWTVTPVPGLKKPSRYTWPGSFFDAYTSFEELPRDGQLLPAESPLRAPRTPIGAKGDHLKLHGNGRVGGAVDVTTYLASTEVSVVLLGLEWNFVPTPLGTFWVNLPSLVGILPFGVASTMTLPLPSDASLVHRALVAQSVVLPAAVLSNPSGIQLRL